MADGRGRLRMLVGGAVMTIVGTVILLIGLNEATASEAPEAVSLTTPALAAIFVGAVLFAVGGLTTLVAIVKPLFEKRAIDHRADRLG